MLAAFRIRLGDSGEQCPGVRVARIGEHFSGLSVFDDLAVLHHRDSVG